MHNWIIQAKLWNGIKFPEIPAHFYTGCWIWQGRTCESGHGILAHRDRTYIASRVAYEIATGNILPNDLVVRHRCPGEPNPACCNPAHLASGTVMDNIIDKMVAKRCATGLKNGAYTMPHRRRQGDSHGMSKVTATDVMLIRALYQKHNQYGFGRFISRKFNMTVTNAMRIARGPLWPAVKVPADYALDPGIVMELQADIEQNRKSKSDKIRAVRLEEFRNGTGVFANPKFTKHQFQSGHSAGRE
jgi:hypothetical protein